MSFQSFPHQAGRSSAGHDTQVLEEREAVVTKCKGQHSCWGFQHPNQHFDPGQASPSTYGAITTQTIGVYIDPHEIWHHLRTTVLLSCSCYSPIWFIPRAVDLLSITVSQNLKLALSPLHPTLNSTPPGQISSNCVRTPIRLGILKGMKEPKADDGR